MPNIRETHCCGLGDMDGLQYHDDMGDDEYNAGLLPSPEDCVMSAWYERLAFVTFAQATFRTSLLDSDEAIAFYKVANRQGWKLAAYIRKHKLGTIVGGRKAVNPNSGNDLRVWLWTINRPALERWNKARPSNSRT